MPAVHELSPGQIIARDFQITRRLGEGGMGAVYAAQQLSTGAIRAIKLMRPDLVQDPDMRRRFEQEARISSQIRSDHVVQVLAAGVDEATGAAFLAMELVEGTTLSELMRRGPMGPDEMKEIFAQLCHALGAAHRAGIVHRDLKPENILVGPSHRSGVPFNVKVLDFGIAKVIAESMTRITAAIGTPLWMAPEQTAAGDAITPATDVWALGLLAFHVLTGAYFWRSAAGGAANPPFNIWGSGSPNGALRPNPLMLLREVAIDPLPAASERARELGRADALPPGFDGWFARCVTRDAAARFQDATAANEALHALLAAAGPRASRGSSAAADAFAPTSAASAPVPAASAPVPAAAFASTSPAPPTAPAPAIGYLPTRGPQAPFGPGMPGPWPPLGVHPRAAYPRTPPARAFEPSAGCIVAGVAALLAAAAAIAAAIVLLPALDRQTDGDQAPTAVPATPSPISTNGPGSPRQPIVTAGPVPVPAPPTDLPPPPTPIPLPAPVPVPEPAPAPAGASFNKAAADASLNAAATSARSCKTPGGPTGRCTIRVTFATSGLVSSTVIEGGPFAGNATGSCIAKAFRQARVPPFSGSPVSKTKSFLIN